MRHLKRGRKLGREKGQRRALMKSFVLALFSHGKIKTTLAKAKEFAPKAEKMITRAKKADLHSRRLLLATLPENTVEKLIKETAPSYKNRNGGYTRITKLGERKSDGAKMAILELVK